MADVYWTHLTDRPACVTTIMLDAGANNAPIVSAKQIRYSARWANGSALKSLKFAENKWTAVLVHRSLSVFATRARTITVSMEEPARKILKEIHFADVHRNTLANDVKNSHVLNCKSLVKRLAST